MGASASRQAPWVERCRADTPGCRHVIHFNNAGASLPPQVVLDAVQQFTREEALTGGYETANRRADMLELAYTALADLLNCSPDEIAIVGSATSAWSQVFHGIPFKAGDRVLTSMAEYGSNYLAFLQAARRFGVVIDVIPETHEGDISMSHLRAALEQQPKPVLVAISHISTSSGRVYDAAAVGAAAAAAGVPFLLDACQSAGQLPLDVQELHCDFLTGTSRKFLRGPRGIGFLYCRSCRRHRRRNTSSTTSTSSDTTNTSSSSSSSKDAGKTLVSGEEAASGDDAAGASVVVAEGSQGGQPVNSSSSSSSCGGGGGGGDGDSGKAAAAVMADWEPALIDIHGARWSSQGGYELEPGADRYEQYEVSFSAKAGFGVAVQYLLQQGPQRCWQRTQQLADLLRSQLATRVLGLHLHDRGRLLCGIVSFTLDCEPNAALVKAWLSAYKPLPINVSVSGIGSSRLDFEARGLTEVVRASVSYYNSETEIELLVSALQQLVAVRMAAGSTVVSQQGSLNNHHHHHHNRHHQPHHQRRGNTTRM